MGMLPYARARRQHKLEHTELNGDDMKRFRRAANLSRRALSELTGLHPDSIRYWESKARVDLRGYAPDLILKSLGMGHLSRRGVYPSERFLTDAFGNKSTSMRAREWVLEIADKPAVKVLPETCGARTRKGKPCRARALMGRKRCKFHGGASTGPRTAEGRQHIVDAQRRRWAAWRASQ